MEGREGKESAPLDLNPGDATVIHYNFLPMETVELENFGN